MDFWARLESVRERWNVLEHPFYQRWSQGELSLDELATYAGEYHHAVVALADAASSAARHADPDLRALMIDHAREEASHVALWEGFTDAVGGAVTNDPAPETRSCANAWAGDDERSMLESLVALYAIESGTPEVALTKRAGLIERYGIDAPEALAYFDVHATLDVEHAAQARELIEPRLPACDHDWLLEEAESVLRANWELLDGVERLNALAAA